MWLWPTLIKQKKSTTKTSPAIFIRNDLEDLTLSDYAFLNGVGVWRIGWRVPAPKNIKKEEEGEEDREEDRG